MPVHTRPVIGYDNLLTQAGATVSGDGTNPENAYDWFQDDVWTTGAASGYLRSIPSGSETCDYFAISTHTLATRSSTAKLQYWTGAAYADVPGATVTPSSDVALMVTFEPITAARFQLVITTDGTAVTIGVASFGELLEFSEGIQFGYSPPRFARNDTLYNNVTQGGKFVGRSLVRTGVTGNLNIMNLDEQWSRNNLDPFLLASRTQGWFLLWNPLERSDEAAYCWTTKTPNPQQTGGQLTSVQIAYEGVTV